MAFKAYLIKKKDLKKGGLSHEESHLVLSYYHLKPIDDPKHELALHKSFFFEQDYMARIYISTQGVNGTLSAPVAEAYRYMRWLASRKEFPGIYFKVHESNEHVFSRLQVKIRKELVGYGEEVPLQKRQQALSPRQWREALEDKSDKLILDIRNDYEWELGHFEGAEKPGCNTFRDFKKYAENIKERVQGKDTKVLMCCTGGIRCEFFSNILDKMGVKNVYQLDGGIINYGIQEKSKHWKGKLYVFDDRLSVPLADDTAEVVGKCHFCDAPSEKYYNCSNLTCNTLFLACDNCLEKSKGACKKECEGADKKRPFTLCHKPFRRWHTYANTK